MPKLNLRVAPGVGGKAPSSSTDANRGSKKLPGGGRDRATVKRLKMYTRPARVFDRKGRVQRDKGDLTSNVQKQVGAGRTVPNQRWFGNTRTVSQDEMREFRDNMARTSADPYSVVLKRRKVPLALLRAGMDDDEAGGGGDEGAGGDGDGAAKGLLRVESFEETFSKRRWRKRPKLAAGDVGELLSRVSAAYSEKHGGDENGDGSNTADDGDRGTRSTNEAAIAGGGVEVGGESEADRRYRAAVFSEGVAERVAVDDPCFDKGQSKRIWNELYKVIDSSDVLLQVLDARDPVGTRSPYIERFLRRECPHKHVVLILNKCDLVPKGVTARWLQVLGSEYPTVAFGASSMTKPFGRGAVLQLLRQFSRLHASDRKSISCGIVGYPNVGKSSVINALKGEKVVSVAPLPGETKVWQYISLFRRVYLVDCPGVVHERHSGDATDAVLRGVVRVESLRDCAAEHVPRVLRRVKREHLERTYKVKCDLGALEKDDHEHDDGGEAKEAEAEEEAAAAFLERLARRTGKLLVKGEPDVNAVAKMVIADYMRGRLPWYVPPPPRVDDDDDDKAEEEKAEEEENGGEDDKVAASEREQRAGVPFVDGGRLDDDGGGDDDDHHDDGDTRHDRARSRTALQGLEYLDDDELAHDEELSLEEEEEEQDDGQDDDEQEREQAGHEADADADRDARGERNDRTPRAEQHHRHHHRHARRARNAHDYNYRYHSAGTGRVGVIATAPSASSSASSPNALFNARDDRPSQSMTAAAADATTKRGKRLSGGKRQREPSARALRRQAWDAVPQLEANLQRIMESDARRAAHSSK